MELVGPHLHNNYDFGKITQAWSIGARPALRFGLSITSDIHRYTDTYVMSDL